MPPKKQPEEGLIVVLDVGKSMVSGSNPRIMDAKRALQGLIQSMILYRPKCLFGLVLFGTEEAKNTLDYPNCYELYQLAPPSVTALKAMGEVQVGDEEADFLSGLVLAVNQLAETDCKGRRIILITDGCSETSDLKEDFDQIIQSVEKFNIDLDVLGADLFGGFTTDDPVRMENMVLLQELTERTGGRSAPLQVAISALAQLRKKTVLQRSLMSAELEITQHIRLPFKTFTFVREEKMPSMSRVSTLAPGSKVEKKTTYTSLANPDIEIPKEQLVKAYRYGRTFVPFTEVDQQVMKYEPDTCMRLIGFTKTANVPRSDYMSSPNLIVPNGGEELQKAYSSLVQALYETDRLAIVRLASRKKCHLGVLIPYIKPIRDEEAEGSLYAFLYFHLPFADDIRDYYFPNLDIEKTRPQYQPSADQLERMEEYILTNSLMRTKQELGEDEDFEDEEELVETLNPKTTYNPILHHFYLNLGFRALNPDRGLPPRDPAFGEYLDRSRAMSERAEEVVKRLKEGFPLEKVEKSGSKRKRLGEDIEDIEALVNPPPQPFSSAVKKEGKKEGEEKISFDSLLKSKTTTVGFVDPVGDFGRILERKDDDLVESAIRGLINIIQQLVKESVQDQQYPKAMECVVALRKGCVEQEEPDLFNTFLRDLRATCEGKIRGDFWNLIFERKITLISSEETKVSTILPDEAELFLEAPQPEDSKEEKEEVDEPSDLDGSDEDADDLLDLL